MGSKVAHCCMLGVSKLQTINTSEGAQDKAHETGTTLSNSQSHHLDQHFGGLCMPSLRQCSTLAVAIERQLLGHLSATKMKIGKAPVLLKKAVAMCKSKTGVLAARLLFLASLRHRMATVGVVSHKIHALMVAADRAKAGGDCHKAVVSYKVDKTIPTIHGGEIVDIAHQLALFCQEEDGDGGCPDWTLHQLFNDDDNSCYTEEDDGHHDKPSVIDIIRGNMEVQGLEFNMEDEIDQAADMFNRRFRERMSKSI